MSRILILKEKHGNWYFYVPTDEVLYEISQKIVKARHEAGYWYGDIEVGEEPKEPVKPDNFDNQPDYIKKAYESAYKEYRKERSNYLSSLDEKTALEDALKGGKAAWRFLLGRSKYEYEGVELEHTSNPDEYSS